MTFKTDIQNRIHSDFGHQSPEAIKILQSAIQKTDSLNSERVIRCVVFLSEQHIDKLKTMIEAAILDTRDVMFWAEYSDIGEIGTAKRVRDFNKPFEDSEII